MPTTEGNIEKGYHLNLGAIDKRINSTKRLEHDEFAIRVPFYMKRPTSMENPVVYFRYNSLDTSPQWNYGQIEETDAYYWVTDIIALNANNWEVHLTMDPLATYKDDILKTKCFIEYGFNSDASGSTFRLQDARQNVSNNPTVSTASVDVASALIDDTGIFILSAVGKTGLNTYALSASQMENLLSAVNISWKTECAAFVRWELALPEFMNKLLYGQNAVSCIRNCFWAPIAAGAPISMGSAEITLGDFETGVTGRIISPQRKILRTTTLNIPWPADDWKRMNCLIQLWVPFIGTLVVPVDKCNDAASITIDFALTAVDGGVTVKVTASNGYVVYTGSTSIAASYAVGSSNIDPVGLAGGIVTTIGGVLAVGGAAITGTAGAVSSMLASGGGTLGGAIASGVSANAGAIAVGANTAASGGAGIMQAIQPLNMCAGTMQGASQCALGTEAKLALFYYPPIDDAGFQAVYGYPVMRVSTPANGYCKTRGFSCASKDALASELSYINSCMDSGVFIE